MSFIKSSNLKKDIETFTTNQKKLQSALTQLIANVIYQSIAGSNADQGIKLIQGMKENGYNRVNDTITYLCKMGNFKYSKKDGLQFKGQFPKTEEMAIEMAERAVANPMFTIVKEASVKTEVDVLHLVKSVLANVEKWKKEALENGKTLNIQHEEALLTLKGMLPNS
jgi:hypothetical protein